MIRTKDQVLQSARSELGEKTAAALQKDPTRLDRLAQCDRRAGEYRDAVLKWAFEIAQTDPEVRNEFVASLLPDLMTHAQRNLPPTSAGVGGREDLVQSMLGEALPTLFDADFQNREQFLGYLRNRLSWKSVDRLRRDRSLARGGGHRIEGGSTLDREPNAAGSPLSQMEREENLDALTDRIVNLPERLRYVLLQTLQGRRHQELADELGVSLRTISNLQRRARAELSDRT